MESFVELQSQCQLLYQGALAEISRLQSEVERLTIDNKALSTKNTDLNREIFEVQERKKFQPLQKNSEKELTESQESNSPSSSGSSVKAISGRYMTEDEIAKEVEALSSLPLDTQFVTDDEVIIAEPEVPKSRKVRPSPVRASRPILDDFFGTAPTQIGLDDSRDSVISCTEIPSSRRLRTPSPGMTQSTPPRHNCTIIVRESPISHRIPTGPRFSIPETVPEYGEITPQKNCNIIEFEDNATMDGEEFSKKCGIRLSPSEKLMYVKRPKLDLDMSTTLSPIKRDLQPLSQLTPPKPAAVKGRSPRRKTPKKMLSKGSFVEVEAGMNGIQKMKQTQLNMDYFLANAVRKVEKSTATETIDASFSTPKASSFPFARPSVNEKATSPLQSLENSPDLDETNLSASAINRVARELRQPTAKENIDEPFTTECDEEVRKAPELPNCKDGRRQQPGKSCSCCAAYFDAFAGGDALKQEALNKLSKHRKVQQNIPETPPGFWRPMITQTPDAT